MARKLRHNLIISSVIKFTSNTEYYLNNLVGLCMKNNTSLLLKGLQNIQINPFDIVNMNDLTSMQFKYIDIIAQEKCKGELWSKKLKHVCRFLTISDKFLSNKINKSIDSIWKMRNIIAHNNSNVLKFIYNDMIFEHSEHSNKEVYINFIMHFIEASEIFWKMLNQLEEEALKK